jgi:hypothetical protein
MTAPSRAHAMLAARAKASQDKRQRALTAVQALEAAGTPVRRLHRVNGWPSFSGRVVAAVTMTSMVSSLIRRGRPPAH